MPTFRKRVSISASTKKEINFWVKGSQKEKGTKALSKNVMHYWGGIEGETLDHMISDKAGSNQGPV